MGRVWVTEMEVVYQDVPDCKVEKNHSKRSASFTTPDIYHYHLHKRAGIPENPIHYT